VGRGQGVRGRVLRISGVLASIRSCWSRCFWSLRSAGSVRCARRCGLLRSICRSGGFSATGRLGAEGLVGITVVSRASWPATRSRTRSAPGAGSATSRRSTPRPISKIVIIKRDHKAAIVIGCVFASRLHETAVLDGATDQQTDLPAPGQKSDLLLFPGVIGVVAGRGRRGSAWRGRSRLRVCETRRRGG